MYKELFDCFIHVFFFPPLFSWQVLLCWLLASGCVLTPGQQDCLKEMVHPRSSSPVRTLTLLCCADSFSRCETSVCVIITLPNRATTMRSRVLDSIGRSLSFCCCSVERNTSSSLRNPIKCCVIPKQVQVSFTVRCKALLHYRKM